MEALAQQPLLMSAPAIAANQLDFPELVFGRFSNATTAWCQHKVTRVSFRRRWKAWRGLWLTLLCSFGERGGKLEGAAELVSGQDDQVGCDTRQARIGG